MSCESNSHVAPPPELNTTLATQSDVDSKAHDWLSDEIQSQLPIDVLLITANDHAFSACYAHIKYVLLGYSEKLGMVYLGQFGDKDDQNVKVALIRRAMGLSAALLSVKNAAKILKPKVALFVGICATMRPMKAKLGDVVISLKMATYGNKKLKADSTIEYRGIRANMGKNLISLILSAADGWEPPLKDQSLTVQVHRDAVMLSGAELVDNCERQQELLNYFPDALCVEMDGAGLHEAAYDLGIEWAVIKAVSNFADGSEQVTEDWQPFASAMAASLVYNMFKYPVVLRHWPRYSETEHAKENGRLGD